MQGQHNISHRHANNKQMDLHMFIHSRHMHMHGLNMQHKQKMQHPSSSSSSPHIVSELHPLQHPSSLSSPHIVSKHLLQHPSSSSSSECSPATTLRSARFCRFLRIKKLPMAIRAKKMGMPTEMPIVAGLDKARLPSGLGEVSRTLMSGRAG